MKNKVRSAALLIALTSMIAAGNLHAVLITYDFTDPDNNFIGELVVNDGLFGTTTNLSTAHNLSWAFTWTDPNTGTAIAPAVTEQTAHSGELTIDLLGNISYLLLETSYIPTDFAPSTPASFRTERGFRLEQFDIAQFSWNTTNHYFDEIGGYGEGNITHQATQNSVPSPAPIALLAAGALAFGVQRKVLKGR